MISHSHLCPKSSHGHQRHCRRHFPYSSSLVAELLLVVVDRPWNTRVLLGPFRLKIAGMVEAQLLELATAVQIVQAQFMASEVVRSNLQAQVERFGRTTGERKIGVDTLNLGRSSQFSGTDSVWRDWSVVFRSYAALVHPALKDEMQRVERQSTADTNAGVIEAEQVQASTDRYHLLLHSTSGPALERVVNAGSAEGLRAWQLLVERYYTHIRSRTAGLQFDFSVDMLAKLEAYERDLALYEQASGEKISDGLRVGIVLNRVTDTELATHLLLNSERFQTWALSTRACGCLACKSSSSWSVPDASWSQ